MALLLAMAITIRFIRPSEADIMRVRDWRGTILIAPCKGYASLCPPHLVINHIRCGS